MADILFSAATDFRYIDVGHPLDFTNKAFEALDIVGWQQAETVLTSLVPGYAAARRMEESNAWRNPIDLVELLKDAFAQIPEALQQGQSRRGTWQDRSDPRIELEGRVAQVQRTSADGGSSSVTTSPRANSPAFLNRLPATTVAGQATTSSGWSPASR